MQIDKMVNPYEIISKTCRCDCNKTQIFLVVLKCMSTL